MEITLKFNCDTEEDRFDAERAQRANRAFSVLSDMASYLRSRVKYEDHPEEVSKVLWEVREKLHELLSENQIGDLI